MNAVKTWKAIPSHALPASNCPVLLHDIAYVNPYDFRQKHRHSYFEIILLEKGGGSQRIDFTEITMQDYSCYLILPGQVHLLERDQNTKGHVIQFEEISVESSCLRNYLLLSGQPVIFENNQEKYLHVLTYLNLIQTMQKNNKPTAKPGCSHLLHAFLFQVFEFKDDIEVCRQTETTHYRFLQLVDSLFTENQTVQEYLSVLNTTNKKLLSLTKKHFGMTPLEIIHNRLLLEAKRLLVFEDNSYKEVGYRLGFKSPSGFAHFIKGKTGCTPGQLRNRLMGSAGAEPDKEEEKKEAALYGYAVYAKKAAMQ